MKCLPFFLIFSLIIAGCYSEPKEKKPIAISDWQNFGDVTRTWYRPGKRTCYSVIFTTKGKYTFRGYDCINDFEIGKPLLVGSTKEYTCYQQGQYVNFCRRK